MDNKSTVKIPEWEAFLRLDAEYEAKRPAQEADFKRVMASCDRALADYKVRLASQELGRLRGRFTEMRTELDRHVKSSNATLQIIEACLDTERTRLPDHSDNPQIACAKRSLERLGSQIRGMREKVKKDQSCGEVRIRSLETQWVTHKASFDRATGAKKNKVASHFTDVMLTDFNETSSGIERRKEVTTEGITDLRTQWRKVQQACHRALADFKASHGGKTPQEIHFDRTMASYRRTAEAFKIEMGQKEFDGLDARFDGLKQQFLDRVAQSQKRIEAVKTRVASIKPLLRDPSRGVGMDPKMRQVNVISTQVNRISGCLKSEAEVKQWEIASLKRKWFYKKRPFERAIGVRKHSLACEVLRDLPLEFNQLADEIHKQHNRVVAKITALEAEAAREKVSCEKALADYRAKPTRLAAEGPPAPFPYPSAGTDPRRYNGALKAHWGKFDAYHADKPVGGAGAGASRLRTAAASHRAFVPRLMPELSFSAKLKQGYRGIGSYTPEDKAYLHQLKVYRVELILFSSGDKLPPAFLLPPEKLDPDEYKDVLECYWEKFDLYYIKQGEENPITGRISAEDNRASVKTKEAERMRWNVMSHGNPWLYPKSR